MNKFLRIGLKVLRMVLLRRHFRGKSGIEIGGPSQIFKNYGFLPLYRVIKSLDGCNFSSKTIWEGTIENGSKYNYFEDKIGTQFVSEATDLSFVSDAYYDFVLSSHCLEHVANPLKALKEWRRVIQSNGLLLLILPNKKYTFDHLRPATKFTHLVEDFKNDVTENDLTHLDEILKLHNLSKDPSAGQLEQFKERSLKNFENRALHHHVFSSKVIHEMLSYLDFEVLKMFEGQEFIILAQKR